LAYNGICPWANRVWEAFRPSSSKFFMESYMIASWELWNIRNSIIFDNGVPSFNLWRRKFRAQGFLRLVRVSCFFYSLPGGNNLMCILYPAPPLSCKYSSVFFNIKSCCGKLPHNLLR
jgi:hypothetical protein